LSSIIYLSLFLLNENERRYFSLPDYVTEKIRTKLADKKETYSIPEVINALAGSNSWTPTDIIKLEQFSEDDYFQWMISDKNDNLLRLIGEFIVRFGNGKNDHEKEVVEKVKMAIDKMSQRSRIDQLRVENIVEYKKE
jgi:hypothetical protein